MTSSAKVPFFQLCEESGRYQARRQLTAEEIIKAAKAVLKQRLATGPAITSPQKVRDFLVTALAGSPFEVFAVLFLDNRHRIIAFEEMFRGTVDGAVVPPREVVRAALNHNAAAVILAHNHPSGNTDPSKADVCITKRLGDALGLIDVRVLDHIIVGGDKSASFAEKGLI